MKNRKIVFISIFSFMLAIFGLGLFCSSNIDINKVYAEEEILKHNVNFINPDNSLLYSVEVPNTSTLQDIQETNLLINSDFSVSSDNNLTFTGSNVNVCEGWYTSALASLSTYDSISNQWTFSVSGTTTPGPRSCIQQTLTNYEMLRGETVTLSISYCSLTTNVLNSNVRISIYDGSTVFQNLDSSSNFCSLSKTISLSASTIVISIQCSGDGQDYSIIPNFMKLEIGSVPTDYYKSSYINKLLKQNSDSLDYLYDFPTDNITSDIYVFPKYVIPTSNLINNLDNLYFEKNYSEFSNSLDMKIYEFTSSSNFIDGVDFYSLNIEFGLIEISSLTLISIGSEFVPSSGNYLLNRVYYLDQFCYVYENTFENGWYLNLSIMPNSSSPNKLFITCSPGSALSHGDGFSLEIKGCNFVSNVDFDYYGLIYDSAYELGYSNGHEDGYYLTRDYIPKDFYNKGYQDGYYIGFGEDSEYLIKDGFYSVVDAPFNVLKNALNFEIFGINLSTLVLTLVSLIVLFWLISKFRSN